ncbi:hypothetical protein DEO72_LG1g488 [Vigna unguiculata]|uniref:Uncharacterized protein n=1 Tax=Vigna unguiculata TaxID=3917 RepID=A0A4D6KMP3_VIGUN|nr:hypothetical protein DEO72_LG1g488 [Vigna unguiculata]
MERRITWQSDWMHGLRATISYQWFQGEFDALRRGNLSHLSTFDSIREVWLKFSDSATNSDSTWNLNSD